MNEKSSASSELNAVIEFGLTSLSSLHKLLAPPSREELTACWELCRLHNNIGFWIVWLPTVWSMAMVYHAQDKISWVDMALCAAKFIPLSFGIKSLAVTIDDILDYDIDSMVERTAKRPIPRGAISLERAWIFFLLQVAIGFWAAWTFLEPRSLEIASLIFPLYIIYPTCKRWTHLAPIPLGIMCKIGVFMGWSSLTLDGQIPWNILVPVYVGAFFWQFTYETIYQHQDKIDDAKIGMHSPALLLGSYTIPVCYVTSLLFFGGVAYGGFLNSQGIPFYVSIAIAAALFLYQLSQTDVDVPKTCKNFFLLSPLIGQILAVGLVADGITYRLMNHIAL